MGNTFITDTQIRTDNIVNSDGTGSPAFPLGISVSGATQFGNGTATAPAITFTSDTDLGIFRKAANSLAFGTNNGLEVGSFDSKGAWTFGPSAGIGIVAGYHSLVGAILASNGTNARGSFSSNDILNVGANFYRSGDGTLRASSGSAGVSYLEISRVTSGTAFDFVTSVASQASDGALASATSKGSVSVDGVWSLGPVGSTAENLVVRGTASTSATHKGGGGLVPVGFIGAYNPGYYQNGTNGTFTVAGPATNSITDVNTFLNPQGWYVCNGAAVNVAASPIWNAANRFLPKLDNSRFLMGSTAAGTVLDNNNTVSIAHDHSVTSNVSVSNHTLVAANIPTLTSTGATTGTGSTVATSTVSGGSHTHGFAWGTVAGSSGNIGSTFQHNGTIDFPNSPGNVTSTSSSHTHAIQSLTVNSGITLSATYTNASPTAITHSVTNNAVTSGAASVTSVSVLPQYLSTYFIIRVF